MNLRTPKITIISAIIAAGILVRVLFGLIIKPLCGDTAVFALMAKHILELKELPLYIPLAHYGGALSSYVAAALFALFGISYSVYMAIGIAYSSIGLIVGCVISRKILDDFGASVSCALIAIPSALILYWSTYIGYAENFLLIPVLLLLAMKINRGECKNPAIFMALTGIVSGIALWVTPNTAPAVLTIVSLLIIGNRSMRSPSAVMLFLFGIFIGYGPAIIYNFQYPGAALFRLAGRVLDLDRSALSNPNLFVLVIGKLLWKISTIPASFAHIPRLTAELISLPVAALFIISIAVSFTGSLRIYFKDRRIDDIGVVFIYAFWCVLFYVILIGSNLSRYMVPLYIVAPLLIGNALSKLKKLRERLLSIVMIGIILLLNIETCIGQPTIFRVERYARLTDWLVKNDALRGYSDYETAYIVQFGSNEKVLVSPTLFHPTFDDRYPEYTEKVRSAADVCYIIDGRRRPETIRPFEKSLGSLINAYAKYRVGDFIVYRGIPSRLKPDDIWTGLPIREKL